MVTVAGASNVYDYSVPLMEGGQQQLSGYAGKKILIVTLPVLQNNNTDSLLYSLDTLATVHSFHLNVIAVPSYEDGFTAGQKTSLLQWYRSKLGSNITITDGLYTRKGSEIQQHPLFKWLTKATGNGHFDIDASGPDHKFFLTQSGVLYAVLKPNTKMWSKAVNKTVNLSVQ
jgi:glutathione peroxidase-family protein